MIFSKNIIKCLVSGFFLLNFVNVQARVPAEGYRFQETESQVLRLDHAYSRVLVVNPEIANVVKALNNRELLVRGNKPGRTELVIWYSDKKREIQHIPLEITVNKHRLEGFLRQIDPKRTINLGMHRGKVVLTGYAEDILQREEAERLLTGLGYDVINLISLQGSQQVQLFVQFAEVVRSHPKRSGFALREIQDQFGIFPPGGGASGNFLLNAQSGVEREVSMSFPQGSSAFQLAFNGRANLFGVLSLMEGHSLARVLAQPTLVVESGQTAKFLAGGEMPVPLVIDNSVSIEYKQFGISLEFTPTVLADRMVSLHVIPEVSGIDPSVSIKEVPGIKTRRTETTIRLRDGESFVISGLLQDELRSVVHKVPLLGDIPVLGILFRSAAYESGQSELVMVVKPKIVGPIPEDETIPLPGENLVQPGNMGAFLLGRLVEERDGKATKYPIGSVGLEMP